MRIAYRLLYEPEPHERLSLLRNEMCHLFHDHADGNGAMICKDRYARLLAAQIDRFPFLVARLLGTGNRVIRMATHRALELRRPEGPLVPGAKQP